MSTKVIRKASREECHKEIIALTRQNGGVLKVEEVIEFARNPDTACHHYPGWNWDNDEKAAYLWRTEVARHLVRWVEVTIPEMPKVEFRAMVSLPNDRASGGGYRETIAVLSDAEQREIMLQQALDDLNRWKEKYKALKELAPVFVAAKSVTAKARKGTRKLVGSRS